MGFLPKNGLHLGHEGKAFYLDFLDWFQKKTVDGLKNIKIVKTEMLKTGR